MRILRALTVLSMTVLAGDSGCGDLPALPTSRAPDGASRDSAVDDATVAAEDSLGSSAMDGPVAGVLDAARATIDASGGTTVDVSGGTHVDASGGTHVDASALDAPMPLVCPAGFADCDGKYDNGCETAINTPAHCGGCANACAAVANGTATCVNNKCTVKCTAPYQDCDGKYDNGCEIPVGQGNACDRGGLAAFSGSKPPCGTPYCGSAPASNAVANFGSWYCSFCDHCYTFGNGGSYCLYTPTDNGTFSGERCSSCCAAGGSQVCTRQ